KGGEVGRGQGMLEETLQAARGGLATRERLVAAAPGNTQWQHDLGISHERIGGVFFAQLDFTGALKEYEAERDIFDRLAVADPSNTQWQRNLSVSHEKIGDVLVTEGKPEEALKVYRDSLALIERLVPLAPRTPL